LADVGTGATPNRSKVEFWLDGDVPWVTSGVANGDYVDKASEFVTQRALAETNLTLYPAGTLLVAMYGEGKTRGKCAELRIPATTNQALAALQVNDQVRAYVRHFLELNYQDMRKVASGGVQPNLNLSLVRAVAVPLPPLAEQQRIVAEVDRRLTLVRSVETEVDTNLKRAQALRQSMLSKAFSAHQ
jgi:type I restriction enzyme S subunit